MLGDFQPAEFVDTYTERLSALVDAKANTTDRDARAWPVRA